MRLCEPIFKCQDKKNTIIDGLVFTGCNERLTVAMQTEIFLWNPFIAKTTDSHVIVDILHFQKIKNRSWLN